MLMRIAYDRNATDKPYGYDPDLPYNAPPPLLTPISEAEFAKSDFFVYSPEYMEFKQVYMSWPERKGPLMNLRCFYMPHGHGYAVTSNYWDGTVQWFRFGCKHDYKELSRAEAQARGISHYGNAYHVFVCQSCGVVHKYDSSG